MTLPRTGHPGHQPRPALPALSRRGFFGGALGAGLVGAGAAGAWAAPQQAAATDLLVNGGFEEVTGGLPDSWRLFEDQSAQHIAASQDRVRSGEWSLSIDDTDGGQAAGLRSAPAQIAPGQEYEASVFCHLESGRVSVYLEFWDADQNRVAAEFREQTFAGNWQRIQIRGIAPDEAVSATILLYSPSSNVGQSHFDDASLHQVQTAAPELFGPASLTAAVRGAVVRGDTVFITSRFNAEPGMMRLGEIDVNTGEVRSVTDLQIDSSGGQALAADDRYVYIGPAGSDYVWRFDTDSGELEQWAQPAPAGTWYYAMTVDGDYLYIGTYPDCEVIRINLSDGQTFTYGRVSDSLYATAVVVDSDFVYGGSAAPGGLLRWPKDGGQALDLTEHLSDSPVGILDMVHSEGYLYVASGRQVISIRTDGSDRVVREIPEEDRYIDQLAVGPDGSVYALARLTSNHYRVTSDALVNVGQPIADAENQMLTVTDDGALVGVSGLGHIWNMAPDGPAEVWDTATSDFGYPEEVQSMLLHSRQRIWVGGHYAMTVHQPHAGRRERFDINGEPKAMAEGRRGIVYAGMYPSGQILAIEPSSLSITEVGTLGNEQMRIRTMYADAQHNRLLVASGPSGGLHTGALTFVDVGTGELDVHREYLQDQAVMDLAVDGSTVYIVGDTYGEGTSGPIRQTAQVAAIDIPSREVIWREELAPDWESYESVHVAGDLLYLMGRRPRGHWFAYDLQTQQVVLEGDLGGYGRFGGEGERVFSWVHWALEIGELPGPAEPDGRLIHGPITNGWYNNPMFNIARDGQSTWGMWGSDLARISLAPPQ